MNTQVNYRLGSTGLQSQSKRSESESGLGSGSRWPLRWALVLSTGLAMAAPAHALYRCGNSFQDTPCPAGTKETPVNPAIRNATAAGPAAAPVSKSPFAPACGRIGLDAQRIVWNREGGATQEKQIAELPRNTAYSEMVKTIEAVYSQRGTAPEIRSAIEAQCIAEKQRQADAADALKALNEQAAGKGPRPAAESGLLPVNAAAPINAPVPASPANGVTPSVASAREGCKNLRLQDDALRASQPTRGTAATLQLYNDKRRQMDNLLSAAKC